MISTYSSFLPLVVLAVGSIDQVSSFLAPPSLSTTQLFHRLDTDTTLKAGRQNNDIYHQDEKITMTTTNNDQDPTQNRRAFMTIVSSAFLSMAAITLQPTNTLADEPLNLYYKSQSDQEDPLAVFGKSLQNMNLDSSAKNNVNIDDGNTNVKSETESSILDITLPSSSSSSSSPPGMPAMTLDEAIRAESQKRRIDPRTHG